MITMLKNAVIELGYENKSGSILYSGNETLRKGNFYFLGANPGGHSDQSNSKYPDTILNQVLRKNSYPSFNEYFDGKWKRSGSRSSLPGHALLQKRIKYLFTKLDIKLVLKIK